MNPNSKVSDVMMGTASFNVGDLTGDGIQEIVITF